MKDVHRGFFFATVSALVLGLASHFINRFLQFYGVRPSVEFAFDDLVIGVFGGLTVYLAWSGERRSRIQERLTLVAELNHHVRNALTTIVLYAEYPDLKKRLQTTSEAVDRIEWVLRELVPTAAAHKGKPRLFDKEG